MTVRKMRNTRPAWRLLAIGAAATAFMITTPAQAQYGQAAGIARSTTPEYYRRDVLIFVENLDLDESQRLIVEGLFEDYIDTFDQGFAGVQQRLVDLRPQLQEGDKNRVMKLVFEPFLDWFKEYDRLGEQFVENVRTVLNEQQTQEWPAFRRLLRREKTMQEGQLAGEKLDLFQIVQLMRLVVGGPNDETARRIQPLLDAYDLALDAALKGREDALKRGRSIMVESIQDDAHDRSLQVMREQIRHRVQVRDVNLQYLDLLAESLSDSIGEELRRSALAKAFPQTFRPTTADRMYGAALTIEGLDPDALASIESLFAAYTTELAGMNQILFEAVKQHDPQVAIERAESFASRMRGERVERSDDPTRKLFDRREDLGFVYIGLLNDLLTEEQFAALPGASRWYQHEKGGTASGNRTTREASRVEQRQDPRARRGTKVPDQATHPGDARPGGTAGGGRTGR